MTFAWKYRDDQPRDDHGRWTSDGESPTVESLAAQNVHVRDLQLIDPPLRQLVLDEAQSFRDRFPKIPLVIDIDQRVDNAIASTRGYWVSLSPEWYGSGGAARFAAYNPQDARAGWSAQPGAAGTIEHEFGHIIDWMDRMGAGTELFNGWGRAETNSGSRDLRERFAEAFSQLALRPESEYTTDAQRVNTWLQNSPMGRYVREGPRKAAIASAPTTDLLALRELLVKFSLDQPRDDHGRWTSGTGDGSYGDMAKAHLPNLTYDEQQAVLEYQYSTGINNWLRGQRYAEPGETKLKRNLDSAFKKAVPLKQDLIVYRGGAGLVSTDKPPWYSANRATMFDGKTGFKDEAYLSTTQDLPKAQEFANWAKDSSGGQTFVMELRVPAGSAALPVDLISTNTGSMWWPGSEGDGNWGLTPVERFDLDTHEWLLPRNSAWEPLGMNNGHPVYGLKR